MDPERLTPAEYVTAACVAAVALGLQRPDGREAEFAQC